MKPSALIEELRSEPWAMEPEKLAAFFRMVATLGEVPHEVATRGPVDSLPVEMRGSVAVIPISGMLMKKKPSWMSYFGIDATDTGQVRSAVESAAADPKVRSIVLHVNSPGGQAAGVLDAADAIHAARSRKPVHSIVDGMAASGAYWLASQASSISAPADALLGSIGAYQVVYDESKAAEQAGVKVHVVRSGEHKGMGVMGAPVTEAQLAMMQKIIDGTAEMFTGAVARGRSKKPEQIKELATGAVWLAGDAKSQGLVDHMEPVTRAFARLAPQDKEAVMANETTSTNDDAMKAVVAAERKRVSDIKSAFPKHAAFALEQIEKGATLAQAQDAFKDLRMKELEAALVEKDKALEEAKAAASKPAVAPAPTQAPVGAQPAPRGADPSAGSSDFLAEALALAEKKGIAKTQAMSQIAAQKPELHRAYIQAMREKAPQVFERKRALNMR